MNIQRKIDRFSLTRFTFGILENIFGDQLKKLGVKYQADKITHHNYHHSYVRFIQNFRKLNNSAMLEIGIDEGRSLGMWLEYFKKSFVYGIDIKYSKSGKRYKILKADQSDLDGLKLIVKNDIKHPIFLIVDDGSHIPEHQCISFDFLFSELLVPGGAYVIEDVEVSYWSKGTIYGYDAKYGYCNSTSIIEIFKNLIDDLNAEFLTNENKELQTRKMQNHFSKITREAISSINFSKNCIIITKKTREEMALEKREYRFPQML